MTKEPKGHSRVMEEERFDQRTMESEDASAPRRVSETPKAGGSSGRSAMARYDVQVCALLLVLYVIPFFVARSAIYEKWNLSYYSRPLNYAYETPVKDADVIVFGDSTAMFGIDPSQMQKALGMTVLNLPNTHGSLMINNDLPLERYLARNKPPKLIVFYFAPWDFNYGNVSLEAMHVFEGEELLARQGTGREVLAFLMKKPVEVLLFPLRFYADSLQFLSHRVSHAGQEEMLARTHGTIENVDVTVLASPCQFPPLLLDNIQFPWVKALGEKYRKAGTDVVFFVAPVPACTNISEVMNHDYGSLPAKAPVVLPVGEFVRDIRYIHPHKEDVPMLTENLLAAVRPRLAATK